jgi:hypothetical protein
MGKKGDKLHPQAFVFSRYEIHARAEVLASFFTAGMGSTQCID